MNYSNTETPAEMQKSLVTDLGQSILGSIVESIFNFFGKLLSGLLVGLVF